MLTTHWDALRSDKDTFGRSDDFLVHFCALWACFIHFGSLLNLPQAPYSPRVVFCIAQRGAEVSGGLFGAENATPEVCHLDYFHKDAPGPEPEGSPGGISNRSGNAGFSSFLGNRRRVGIFVALSTCGQHTILSALGTRVS